MGAIEVVLLVANFKKGVTGIYAQKESIATASIG
jgi:hypothetical protein